MKFSFSSQNSERKTYGSHSLYCQIGQSLSHFWHKFKDRERARDTWGWCLPLSRTARPLVAEHTPASWSSHDSCLFLRKYMSKLDIYIKSPRQNKHRPPSSNMIVVSFSAQNRHYITLIILHNWKCRGPLSPDF